MKLQRNRGYVGLLALLITFAIITFLMWRVYGTFAPKTSHENSGKSTYSEQKDAIQKAKDTKALIENRTF